MLLGLSRFRTTGLTLLVVGIASIAACACTGPPCTHPALVSVNTGTQNVCGGVSYVSGPNVIINAVADDEDGLSAIKIYVDGALLPPACNASGTHGTCSRTWDTTNAAQTQHTIKAVAVDRCGPHGEAIIYRTVDNTAPSAAALTSPTQNACVEGTIWLEATATDNFAIKEIRFYRGGVVLIGTATSSPFKIQWDTTTVADGARALWVVAYDCAGHLLSTAGQAVVVRVNNNPPQLEIESPSDGARYCRGTIDSLMIRASASDENEIERVEFEANGQAIGTDYNNPPTDPPDCDPDYCATWDISAVEAGWYTLTARAYDRCGKSSSQSITIAIYEVTSVMWEPINSALDGNENAGGGKRIYSCKQSPDDQLARNTVRAKATVNPALQDVVVYFKSFDVDDPSAETAPVDDNDPGDPPQSTGNDNRGTPKSGTLSAGDAVTDQGGVASVDLAVTMQPGDNFRVAASCDQTYLNACVVTDTTTVKHPTGGNLPTIRAKITDMLTVWRKLHVEVDSMGAVVGNTVAGNIDGVTDNGDTSTVLTSVGLDDSIDRFEGGVLTNDGLQFAVIGNSNGPLFSVTVYKIGGLFGITPIPGAFSLVDDDQEAMPHAPNTGWVESRFKDAYVKAVFDGGGNPANDSTNVEFDLNVEDLESDLQVNKGMQSVSTSGFWASYLQGAFQGRQEADGDPDGGPNAEGFQVGRTPTSFGSLVFAETIRDCALAQGSDRDELEEKAVVHELGHQFEREHADGGVMSQGWPVLSPWFSDLSLSGIRSVAHP